MPEPVPWSKGIHPTYSAFVLEIHIRKDKKGDVRTGRRLQDARDEAVISALGTTGGMEEGAWALLTEAVRAEAMLQLVVKLSNDPEFKDKLVSEEVALDDLIENLSKDTLEQVRRSLDALVPALARETLHLVRDGLRNENE